MKGPVVDESQGQLASRWPNIGLEQCVKCNSTADLVAVGDGIDHHVRAGFVTVKRGHEFNTSVAFAIGLDIRGAQFDRVIVGGHGMCLLTFIDDLIVLKSPHLSHLCAGCRGELRTSADDLQTGCRRAGLIVSQEAFPTAGT